MKKMASLMRKGKKEVGANGWFLLLREANGAEKNEGDTEAAH